MSSAHKGSKLLLKDQLIPVDFSSTHFDYNVDATGIQYGNLVEPLAGSVYTMRPSEGKFGGGIAIEEGTTNVWNGNLIVYNNFSSSGQSTATLTTLSETFMGYPIYRLQYTPISANAVADVQTNYASHGAMSSLKTSYQSGNTYMSSIYWRAYKSDVSVGGTASNISGWSDVATYSANGGWNRSVAKWSANTTSSDNKFWSFKSPSAVANETITIDWACPQIEQKLFPTSYISGNRSYGRVDYGDAQQFINPSAHSVSMWISSSKYGTDSAHSADWNMCFSLSPAFYIGINMANSIRASVVDANGTQQVTSYSFSFNENTWYHVGYTFSNGALNLYLNGNLVSSTTIPTSTIKYQRNTGETRNLYIGGYYNSSVYAWNGIVSDVRIDSTAISNEDFMTMYISQKPLYNPYDYRSFAY